MAEIGDPPYSPVMTHMGGNPNREVLSSERGSKREVYVSNNYGYAEMQAELVPILRFLHPKCYLGGFPNGCNPEVLTSVIQKPYQFLGLKHVGSIGEFKEAFELYAGLLCNTDHEYCKKPQREQARK